MRFLCVYLSGTVGTLASLWSSNGKKTDHVLTSLLWPLIIPSWVLTNHVIPKWNHDRLKTAVSQGNMDAVQNLVLEHGTLPNREIVFQALRRNDDAMVLFLAQSDPIAKQAALDLALKFKRFVLHSKIANE
jgi:hypothetical protein